MALETTLELGERPGEGGKRERAKAANRDAILTAARRVFSQMGYDGASVRDIIRGTDLASGTFYNYFRSKEEVFEALQNDIAKRFRPLLHDQRERAESFEDFVRGSLDAYFHFLAAEKSEGRLMMGEHEVHVSVRLDTPEMKAVFDEVRSQIEFAIGRGMAPAIDADYFAAAAIGVAREVGDRMLIRGADTAGASAFCASFLLTAMAGLPQRA